MNADQLRKPLTDEEWEWLAESCKQSNVPIHIEDPAVIDRVAALLKHTERPRK